MRTARFLRWGTGTAAGVIALGAVGGCAMSGGGVRVVGANPGGGAGGGGTVAVVAASHAGSTASAGAPSAWPAVATDASATVPSSTSSTRTGGRHTSASAAIPTSMVASTGASASASASAAASASASASTTSAAACGAGDLSLQVFESPQAASAGHDSEPPLPIGSGLLALHSTRVQQLTLVFTNVSHSACMLRGYPSVDFLRVGARGPLSAPDSFSRAAKVADVRLSPGGAAESLITFTTNSYGNSRGSRCDAVAAVRAYAPGSTRALISGVRDDGNGHVVPDFFVCGHKVVVRALQAH